MYFLLHFTLLIVGINGAITNGVKDPLEDINITVYDVSNQLVTLFGLDENSKRIQDLKTKLEKVNHYVINNTLVAAALSNVTKETKLNETNFYEALNENDHFSFISANSSKNLFLKLKEKMTRDDILTIVAEKSQKKLAKSARRSMSGAYPKKADAEIMNDVVDKMIGEVPNDNHKAIANESIYWDPQGELEDLKQYHEDKKSGRRIFRGERTTIRYYPFMASIHVMGRFWCGAVLYWHDMAITSASCLQLMHNNRFFRENPRVIQLRMGSNHSRIGGEVIDVMEVYFHPGYNPRTLRNNLAVVRLRRHLKITYHRIPKLIAISHLGHSLPTTAEVLVLGWGVTRISQKMSYEPIFLQRKFLPVYPNAFCKEVYGDKFVTETMFCAGTLTTGEGACDHDAGGPAILSGRLVGVISYGPAICGFANAPTVFTLVGAYADWIETVNESMPAYYRGKAATTTTTKSPMNEFLATYRQNQYVQKMMDQTAKKVAPLTSPGVAEGETTTAAEETTVPDEPEATTEPVAPPSPGFMRKKEKLKEVTALKEDDSDGGWSIDLK